MMMGGNGYGAAVKLKRGGAGLAAALCRGAGDGAGVGGQRRDSDAVEASRDDGGRWRRCRSAAGMDDDLDYTALVQWLVAVQ
ncbi:hypothetical protein VNO80_30547 [Phaseolus coccineus]|uniref:Uncharacterized protein n=1 Tax=Phaseolus coccineus TaxID=3886 RepID=A0AAN9QDJ8_PHACN